MLSLKSNFSIDKTKSDVMCATVAEQECVVVEGATRNPLICFECFIWVKKQLAIFLSVAGGSSWLTYAQQDLKSSLQLIDHQMVAPSSLQSWPQQLAIKVVHMDEINTISRLATSLP